MNARPIAKLSKKAQEAFDDEINRQCAEKAKDMYKNIDCVFLWSVAEEFGCKGKKLLKLYKRVKETNQKLINYYEMNDTNFICRENLKLIGFDIDELERTGEI